MSLVGFRNKIIVFINWMGSYLTYNGGTRLIIRRYEPGKIHEEEDNRLLNKGKLSLYLLINLLYSFNIKINR